MIWSNGSTDKPSRNISGVINSFNALFVTKEGNIYFDSPDTSNRKVEVWQASTNNRTDALRNISQCMSIFVDISNFLYCSQNNKHQVIRKWLDNNGSIFSVVAGVTGYGSNSTSLYNPWGIHVDQNYTLFVADTWNHRIQKFTLGQKEGITVAGASNTITLYTPYVIAFDANQYLYILEYYGHRLVGSGPYGFRCIFGCKETYGSALNQLYNPRSFAFDSYGNIFVADFTNYRILKILLATNSSGNLFFESYFDY